MVLMIGTKNLFDLGIFKISPNDGQVLGFDGAKQRPGNITSFFKTQSQTRIAGTVTYETTLGSKRWYYETWEGSLQGDLAVLDGQRDYTYLNVGQISYYLRCTNFGFNIPTGAIIKGIKVTMNKDTIQGANLMKDYSVKIVKNGAYGTTDKAITDTYWPMEASNVYYGSSTDLWGEEWTAEEINYDNFGVAIAVQNIGGTGEEEAHIDYLEITVYYTI